jgi:hypothetical protein
MAVKSVANVNAKFTGLFAHWQAKIKGVVQIFPIFLGVFTVPPHFSGVLAGEMRGIAWLEPANARSVRLWTSCRAVTAQHKTRV